MKKIGLLYSFNTNKTAQVAKRIQENFDEKDIEPVNAEDINGNEFSSFDNLILGCPTWFDGELPNYWDEFLPELEDLNLKGKTIALFGNGDQVGYPENFVDAIGIMAEALEKQGAEIVGYTSVKDYSYERSKAERGDHFCGLAIDFENQSRLNNKRIKEWCEQLKETFK